MLAMRSMLSGLRVRLFLVAAAMLLALAEPAAAVDLNQQRTFDIPAQKLATALLQFSHQSGMQVVVGPEVGEQTTSGINGKQSIANALSHLLEPSGLTYVLVGESSISVGRPEVSRPSAQLSSAAGDDMRLVQAAEQQSSMQKVAAGGEREAQTASSSQEEDAKKQSIQEVVVTAQRRAQNLQDVPISISVLSAETLDRSTGAGVLDELERVAGVAVTPNGNTGSTISIRGVAPASPSFFTASPVAYYLDSVPFGFVKSAFVPDLGAYDLDRVEVLRGPQGTLYGASSQGGLVRILSRDANLDDFEFKTRGSISETLHGGGNHRGDVAMNVPVIDGRLAARLVAGYQDLSGWIDQPNTGREDANDELLKTLRFKVNAQPTEALSLELSSWFSRSEFGAPTQSSDGRQYLTNIDETQHSDFDLYAFDIGYDFGEISVSSATSYVSYEFAAITDSANPPLGLTNLTNRQFADVFSEEIQLNSTGDGPWRWAGGAIYRDVEERLFQNRTNAAGAQAGIYVQPNDATYFSKSYAVFGELTRAFFDGHFELTAGLRYFHDETRGREDSNLTGSAPVGDSRARTFKKVSPRIVATWLPTEDLTAYASYSEGFRSGVDQAPIALVINPSLSEVQPDNLKNFEIGVKHAALNGRLRFDAAAYYMDWQDVQSASLVFAGGLAFSATFNGPSASGLGFDLNVIAEPVESLTLGASVSWNDLTFDEDVGSGIGIAYRAGDRLSLSPELTGGLWLDYTMALPASGYDLRFSASGNYASERYQRLFGAASAAFVNEPLFTASARLALETPSSWSVALFADNVTDEQTPITGFDPTGRSDSALRMRPRTVGIQFELRY